MGGRVEMPRRHEEFHQIVTILEHICNVNGVTKVPFGVLLRILDRREVNVQLFPPQFQ